MFVCQILCPFGTPCQILFAPHLLVVAVEGSRSNSHQGKSRKHMQDDDDVVEDTGRGDLGTLREQALL